MYNVVSQSLWKPSSFFPETVKSMVWKWKKDYMFYTLVSWKPSAGIFIFRWVTELCIVFTCILFCQFSMSKTSTFHINSVLPVKVLYFSCRDKCSGGLVFPPSLLCKRNLSSWSLALSICLCNFQGRKIALVWERWILWQSQEQRPRRKKKMVAVPPHYLSNVR